MMPWRACLQLLLRSWLINRLLLDPAFPRLRWNLFYRSSPSSTLICVICCPRCRLKNPGRSFYSIIVWCWRRSLRNCIDELRALLWGPKSLRSSPPFWCCTFLTAAGTFCNISFSSFVHICILAAMFGWPVTGPIMSMQWLHSSRTGRVWTLNCLIFMQREPLFVCLTILLIRNRLLLQEVLWSASLGTGGIALRLSPSAATSTAAPPVLVRIMQRFF